MLKQFASRIGLGRGARDDAHGDTGGPLIYAIGDIHGRYDLLKTLLAQIALDYPSRARGKRPILVFCGDYIDRGPQAVEVLEALLWLQRKGDFELRLLKGNHEQALLDFIDEPRDGRPWLRYGGAETLGAYGVTPPEGDVSDADLFELRDDLLTRLPASHLKLLQSLELIATIGDYAFVHAGVRPGTPLTSQSEDDLLWIREDFTQAAGPFEKIIVHGHSWVSDKPQISAHRIGIDTGAYATGILTAVRLHDRELAIMQADAAGERPWDPWAASELHGRQLA